MSTEQTPREPGTKPAKTVPPTPGHWPTEVVKMFAGTANDVIRAEAEVDRLSVRVLSCNTGNVDDLRALLTAIRETRSQVKARLVCADAELELVLEHVTHEVKP